MLPDVSISAQLYIDTRSCRSWVFRAARDGFTSGIGHREESGNSRVHIGLEIFTPF